MKVHGLLLDRHVGGDERRHDGRIAVDERNRRWCSDGFEIGCDNGERMRVAFALDCCDREAMSFLSSSQLTQDPDRVRSFGSYNICGTYSSCPKQLPTCTDMLQSFHRLLPRGKGSL